MGTGCPSTRGSKSSFFNPSTNRPCLSKTLTPACTSSALARTTSSAWAPPAPLPRRGLPAEGAEHQHQGAQDGAGSTHRVPAVVGGRLITGGGLFDRRQLVDAAADGGGEEAHLFVGVVGRAEGVRELPVGEARQDAGEPLRVRDRDVLHELLVLPLEAEAQAAALDALDELVVGEVLGVVAGALDLS